MNRHGVYVRISNVNVRRGDVHVRSSYVHGHTSDVYFRNHRDDVRIHDWHDYDHDPTVVAEVRDLLGVYEYLEYLSPYWTSLSGPDGTL